MKSEEEKRNKVFFEIFPTKKWIHNESGEKTKINSQKLHFSL